MKPLAPELPTDDSASSNPSNGEYRVIPSVHGRFRIERFWNGQWTPEDDVERLRAAIREHRDQKADDRCWMDDEKLYEVLGESVKCDRRVGDKDAMLANCKRFIDQRCEGGHWKSYAELEAEVQRLQNELKRYKAQPTVVTLAVCPKCGQHGLHPSERFCFKCDYAEDA